jgi:zinc transport system permease protein
MGEFFSLGFVQRALVAGAAISLLCGLLSVFVVLRRMAFIGVGVSHAAFGGVALGLYLGIEPLWSGVGFSIMVGLLIEWMRRKGGQQEDTAIGILFAFSMALGVLLLQLARAYNVDVFSFLFGNILAVSQGQLLGMTVVSAVVITLVVLLFRLLVTVSFDEEMAWLSGIPVGAVQYLFIVVVAISVIVSIYLVGIVLVSALLVLPAAISRMMCKRMRSMVLVSMGSSLCATIGGLILSFKWDIPSGATIVLLLSLCFFMLQAGREGLRHLMAVVGR